MAAQRALAAEPWPDGAAVRVRMGLHTGEPLVGGERYVGMGVNRGARICAAGHGGQVLLSNTTRELVEDELPDDVRVVDLGEHELKDVKRPERIFQLEIHGLPSSFPPLRTAESSAFEGREGELARAAERVAWRRLRSRRAFVLAGVAAAVAVAVLVPLLALGGSSSHAVVAPNSAVALDASGSIAGVVPVGAQPAAIASGAGALWVANLADQSVTRVDPGSKEAVRAIPIGSPPAGLAAARNAVWVTGGTGEVSKIDPTYDRLTTVWSAKPVGSGFWGPTTVRPTLEAFGSLWVVDPDGDVSRLDPGSGRVTGSVGVGNDPAAIAAGAGSVWVANSSDGTVTRIDPTTLETTTIPVGHGPAAVSVDAAGAWVANAGDDTVVRVDTGTNAVSSTTPVGVGPAALFATPTANWVANAGDGTVMRLDPRTGERRTTTHVGGTPDALALAAGRVWVTVAPALPRPPARGGIARLATQFDFASLDPALDLNSQVLYATCANLVTYPDKPAPEVSQIVPEVAEAVPTPTHGGTIYTFTIRPGFRFSPPSNEPVTAATFKATIERVTNPRLKSPNASWLSGIAGYERYVTGKVRGLSGVVAHGRTLTIRLSKPDGAFLSRLAGSVACAVPPETPVARNGINDVPSAGPYYIASYTPRQQLVLRRNPNYHGGRPHHLDALVYTIGVDPSQAVKEIEAGTADYIPGGIPAGAAATLAAEYGPGSKAAEAGHRQYFVNAAFGARYLHMNAYRPLFASARLRRAVSYAIDREALAEQGQRFPVAVFSGGPPTSDYLIPSIAGARNFHLYPLRPDLRRAKRLAGHHLHATAILYAASVPPWPQEAQIIRRDLAPLGIHVEVRQFPLNEFFARVSRRGEPFDLAVSGWSFVSADPGDVLSIFDGSPSGTVTLPHFDDPAFDRKLHEAESLSGATRYRTFSRLAYELERDDAPAAAIATGASQDFFSARIGCQVYQPVYGIDLAALCLRRSKA